MRTVASHKDYKVCADPYCGYAVFARQCYPSGDTAFWQQVSKWYWYKKYALDIFDKKVKEAVV